MYCDHKVGISLLLVILLQSHCRGGDPLPEGRMRDYCRKSLQDLEMQLSNVQITGTCVRSGMETEQVHRSFGTKFQTYVKYPTATLEKAGRMPIASVRNEDGRTQFKIDSATAPDKYYIAALGDSLEADVLRYHRRYCKPLSLGALHMFDFSLSQIVGDPEVIWKKEVVRTDPSEGEILEIHADVSKISSYYSGGEIHLWLAHHGAIKWYEFRHAAKQKDEVASLIRGQLTYDGTLPDADKRLAVIPSAVHLVVQDEGEEPITVVDWKLKDAVFDVLDEDDFTLDHFGLGTKPLKTVKRRWPWLLIVNAVVFICAMILVRHGVHKKRSASSSP